jgi:hypothetical protein
MEGYSLNQGGDVPQFGKSATLNSRSDQKEVAGYLHPAYCESLVEFGRPLLLPQSRAWILERSVPNSEFSDAMGCYPLFQCADWSGLNNDLATLKSNLVSLAVVTDPFGNYEFEYLKTCFPDVAKPFKDHFVVDLNQELDEFIHPHHRRNARKALRRLTVEHCAKPIDYLEDWLRLYSILVERHNIKGMTAFSRQSFAKQLQVPGLLAFRAAYEGATVGMVLWYKQGNRAYYHLGAYDSRGYELGASFALFDLSIAWLAGAGLAWLDLGSGAGIGREEQGLTRFKQGWSTGVRTAYFCGRVFDSEVYRQLSEMHGSSAVSYFPAYRAGEFS